MSTCEICGMDSDNIHQCTHCKSWFCDECGDVVRTHKICFDCLGWDEVNESGIIWEEDKFN